jgi:predicted NAD/FAD-binding protein
VTAPFKENIRVNTRVVEVNEIKDDDDTKVNDDNDDTNEEPKSRGRVEVVDSNGARDRYDAVIIAAHAPGALAMLGKNASVAERKILDAFKYQANEVVLHRDASLMPRRKRTWASWNFAG